MKTIAIVFIFSSDSDPAKKYQTIQYTDGTTSCECPGWVYKKKSLPNGERTCKHTRWVDCQLAEQHALRVERYAEAARPVRTVAPAGKQMRQVELQRQRRRVIIIDND